MNVLPKAVIRIIGYGPVDRLLGLTNVPEEYVKAFEQARPHGYPRSFVRDLPTMTFTTKVHNFRSPSGAVEKVGGMSTEEPGMFNVDLMIRAHEESLAAL